MTEKSAFDEEQMRIEEYKLLRKTTIHFDKILHNIRKNTILCAFFLFGLSIEALRSAEILSYGLKPVYLSIGLVLIELLMVLCFFYLEDHYRTYLLIIANVTSKYEEKLNFGIVLNENDTICKLKCDDNRVTISKCLTCKHNDEMNFITRVAHYNLYTVLLTLGFLALSILVQIEIGLSLIKTFLYSITTAIIIYMSFLIYALRNIKNQNKKDKFDDEFIVYLTSIILFIILPYISNYTIGKHIYSDVPFFLSFLIALVVSIIVFFVFSFKKKKLDEIISDYSSKIGIWSVPFKQDK
ncbi:MAG: hypothetical protein C5S41_01205 [Candidatus Methanomarinus sp.]|nr:MAG: hypothetical protein C5S41_01205 [ANME-2 cluster archaeon]